MPEPIIDFSSADSLTEEIIQGFVDKNLVDKETQKSVDKLITKYGKNIFPLLIFKLTNLELPVGKAKEIWEGIIFHMEHLNKMIRRNVGIHVAVMDYFMNISQKLIKFPVIIDNEKFDFIKNSLMIDISSGLYNFKYYLQRIKEEIAKSKRYKTPLSILMIDIDDAKRIKEYLGFEEVNEIIKIVGQTIKKLIRTSDVVIHYEMGGFILILPQTSKKQALIVGEKIRKKIEDLNMKHKVTVSGGVSTFLIDTKKDSLELLDIAKAALYRAKIEGKNRICNYPDERRKFKRIPITEQLKININIISPTELQQHIKKIKDISKGGIAFYSEGLELKPMDYVEGVIKRDNNDISFVGQVTWITKIENNLFEVGIKFI